MEMKKWRSRLLSFFLCICMVASMFAGMDLTVKADVYQGGSIGSGTGGSKHITATGSWYADRYTFTPSWTGVWRFYSANKKKGDPYIIIADSANEYNVRAAINRAKCKALGNGEFASNDDGNGSLNFNVYVFLEAGKSYYIFNSRYSNSDTEYTTYYSYMGAGTITLNKQGGEGGTGYLYGGRSGYSPSKSNSDNWWTTSTGSRAVSKITPPTRRGYAFEGYYTGTNGTGTRMIDSQGNISSTSLKSTFSSNGTLYAHWRALNSTYILDANGGSDGQESVVVNQFATLPTLSALPTRVGYDFDGYYASDETQDSTTIRYKADGSSTYENQVAGQEITLYARWNPKTYSAILNANGGTGGSSVNMVYDATLTSGLSIPAKTGYVFNGYYYNYGQDNQVLYYDNQMQVAKDEQDNYLTWTHATDGIQLVADWTPITYNIQLFSNDDVYGVGSAGNKASGYISTLEDVVYGDMVLPSAQELGLTRDHYDFVGWNIYDEQDWAMFYPYTQYNTGLADTEGASAQLYAAWKMKDNYTISYSINGGDGNYPRNQTIFKGDDLTITETVPTYENHTFIGWYSTPNGQGEGPYMAGDTISNIMENTTFYARWKENKTISYNTNGGVFTTEFLTQYYPDTDEPVKVYLPGVSEPKGFDRTLTEEDMPTKFGYEFKGWSTNQNATEPDYKVNGNTTLSMSGVTEDIILYAVWEIKTYDINYVKSGLEGEDLNLIVIKDADESVKHGDDYGFTISVDDRAVDTFGMMVTVNGVVAVNPVAQTNGNISNYVYNMDSALSEQEVVIGGITLKEYTINYETDGGSFNVDITRSYNFSEEENQRVELPKNTVDSEEITKSGYTFEGWYESPDFEGERVTAFAKSDAVDKSFYAKWVPNRYTIVYNKNGSYVTVNNESVLAQQTCVYDTNVTLATPTSDGAQADMTCEIGTYQFDFLGWSTDASATVAEYNPGEVVRNLAMDNNAEVVLYAVWDITSYMVSYDTNGAESESIDTVILKKGMDVDFPAEPTRTGYTFIGWKELGHTEESDPFVSVINRIDRDYTLVALWEANDYNICYKVVVPQDGKLLADNDVEVTESGTYTANGTEYQVVKDSADTFTIKTEAAVYDTEYTFATMPFVMKSRYEEFLQEKAAFEEILDDVALYYAWQAHDAISVCWQDGAWITDGYNTAQNVWQTNLEAAKSLVTADVFQNYIENSYSAYVAQPDENAADAPVAPTESAPAQVPTIEAGDEPVVVANPGQSAATLFKGWNTNPDAEEALYLQGAVRSNICTGAAGDEEKIFYAIYDETDDYYLFYDVNGGIWSGTESIMPQQADAGESYATVNTSNVPSKVGHTFMGWSYDGTGTGLTTVDLASGHQTVKAIWIPHSYKVYFDRNDFGSYTREETDENQEIISYYYSGIVNVMTKVGDEEPTYDEMQPQNMSYGVAMNLLANNYYSDNYYEFLGWSVLDGPKGPGEVTRPNFVDGQNVKNLPYTYDAGKGEYSVRLYAIWQKKDAFIRFNANGGSGEPASIYREGNETSFALPIDVETPMKEGYSFIGWSSDPDTTEAEYVATVADGMVSSYAPANVDTNKKAVLYAVWKETPYCTIEYVKADGTSGAVPKDTTKYYLGDQVTVDFSKLPVKAGYHFDGWRRDADTIYQMDGDNQVTFEIEATDIAENVVENVITLTEQIMPNTYNVEFYFRGNPIGTKTLTYDASNALDIRDIKATLENTLGTDVDNYTYQGWSVVNGGKVSYTDEQLKNLTSVKDGVVKLYVVMEAKKITITMDNQNNTQLVEKSATYGETLPVVTQFPTKEGYTFAGYYTSVNPDSDAVAVYDANLNASGPCSFNSDVILYAKWVPKTYKVIYVYEGNTLYTDTLTYQENDRETTTATATVFPVGVVVQGATSLYGWSANGQNEGNVYRVGEEYKYDFWEAGEGNDVILYPIIVPDEKVEIVYHANGGVGIPIDTKEYQAGDRVRVLFDKIPTMTNYEFMGWSIDPNVDVSQLTRDASGNFFPYDKNGSNEYEVVAQKNMTFYAIWKIGTYDIAYKTNTSDAELLEGASDVVTVERGSTMSNHAGTIYNKTGYVLQGWSTSKSSNNAVMYDLDSPIETTLTTKDSIDLYTVWKAADVVVAYDTLGGNEIAASSVKYDSTYGMLPVPEREGHTFEGWYAGYDADSKEYSNRITATSVVNNADRHVLYAKWTEDTFVINYHLNDDEQQILNKTYAVGQEIVLLNESEIIREGHELLGYAISENGPVVYELGQSVGTVWSTKNAEINLYCVWDVETGVVVEKTQSYIYYVSNGAGNGLAPSHDIYTTNTKATIRDNEGNMSKYGYYFAGWNTEPDGSGTAYMPGEEIEIQQSMILFANWQVNSYRLIADKDNGVQALTIVPEKEMYAYGEQITITAKLKDGYVWNGFISGCEEDIPSSSGELQADGSYVYSFKMGGAVADLSAVTKANITFNSNGGTFAEDATEKVYAYQTDMVPDMSFVETPTRGSGYTFTGWFTDRNCNNPWDPQTVITKAVTLYAGWGYSANDGEMSVTAIGDQIYTGESLKPAVVVRDGNKILKQGVDYKVTYKNNKNVNKNRKFVEANALEISASSVDAQKVDKKLPYVVITGKGNYSGKIMMNFNIVPKDISNVDVDEELNLYYEQYVSGSAKKALKPAVVLSYLPADVKEKKLKAGKDYTVTYSGEAGDDLTAIPAGARGTYVVKVTATEKGQYTGSFTKMLWISDSESDLANAKVTIKATNLVKNMSVTDLNITVKMGKKTLKQGEDFTAKFVNGSPDRPGTSMVLIQATEGGAYTGSVVSKVVLKAAALKNVQVNMITNAVYTGKNYGDGIVSITDNGVELLEGVDYTTTYNDDISAGKVTVTINGKGIYKNSVRKITYYIAKYDLSNDILDMVTVVAPSKAAEYSNTGAIPEYAVMFGTVNLENGTDFNAQYINNEKCTTEYALKRPQIIINGKGNFTGQINGGYFDITRRTFTQESMRAVASDIKYKENSLLNVKFKIYENGSNKALVAGKDYDKNSVTYTCNDKVITKCPEVGSNITVFVNGINNYKGTYTFVVKVGGESLQKAKNLIVNKYYTGEEINLTSSELGLTYKIKNADEAEYFNTIGTYVKVGETEVCTTLKAKDTIVLEAGRDYDLDNATYVNNVNKGTASIMIEGEGFFIGTKKINFKIKDKSLKWWESLIQ